jgi:hypothetical protein
MPPLHMVCMVILCPDWGWQAVGFQEWTFMSVLMLLKVSEHVFDFSLLFNTPQFCFVCLVFPLHSSGWVSCFPCSWIWWQNWNLENRIWLSLHSFQVDFSCTYQGVLSIYEDINICLRPLILGVIFLCNCIVSVEVWIYGLFKEYG